MVDVDVVEADGVVAHARLVRRRVANADFFPAQDFGTAGGVKADGVAHAVSFDVWNVKGRTLPRAGGNFNHAGTRAPCWHLSATWPGAATH
jgi:hypothetical protein